MANSQIRYFIFLYNVSFDIYKIDTLHEIRKLYFIISSPPLKNNKTKTQAKIP